MDVNTTRSKLTGLLNRWGAELTKEEIQAIQYHVKRINSVQAQPDEEDMSLENTLLQADEVARYTEAARTRDALLTAILAAGGRYLSSAQFDTIKRVQENLWQARQQGNLMACMAIAEESDRDIKALGGPLLIVAHARTCLEQGRLSPVLAKQVRVALQDIDEGIDTNNDPRIRQGTTNLAALVDDVLRELEAAHQQIISI